MARGSRRSHETADRILRDGKRDAGVEIRRFLELVVSETAVAKLSGVSRTALCGACRASAVNGEAGRLAAT